VNKLAKTDPEQWRKRKTGTRGTRSDEKGGKRQREREKRRQKRPESTENSKPGARGKMKSIVDAHRIR